LEEWDSALFRDGCLAAVNPADGGVVVAVETVHGFIAAHKSGDAVVANSAAEVLMAVSPVLEPELKFHELVYGQELGSGSFSTVKCVSSSASLVVPITPDVLSLA